MRDSSRTPNVTRFTRSLVGIAGLSLSLVVGLPFFQTSAGGQAPTGDGGSLRIRSLSNMRPDLHSGGDALIRVDVPASVNTRNVRVTLNEADVTGRFRADAGGRVLTGLVTGLAHGSNTLAASVRAGTTPLPPARLTVVNFPITGPIFSGPQEQPFICETATFPLRSGGTLGPSLDKDCSAATRVDYVYRSTEGGALKPLTDRKNLPADLAQTRVLHGRDVPFIVRIETGTINRGIYQIAILHDPSKEPAPDYGVRPAGWNGRLIFTFGGGCMGGWFRQAITTGGVENDVMLQRGYAVASSTLTVAGNNCNEVLSAETTMMVKERFIEAYGAPLFTIGWGSSGGAYQQHVIADSYPGLIDGLIPGHSFPDMAHALTTTSSDSRLLDRYFQATAVPFTDEQKLAIVGYNALVHMNEASTWRAARINPVETCPDVLPVELRYHPVKNPKGARCSIYDHSINIYGRDPATGFARRPLDNVGIQYGLDALNAGVITRAQFLDLNEKIGGYDIDANLVPKRTEADLEAVRLAYRSGRVTSGGAGLASVPIIEYRAYVDENPKGDTHLRYHSFSMRARLLKANGHLQNHAMVIEDPRYGGFSTTSPLLREVLTQMDRWLMALADDPSRDPQTLKLARARPADLVDGCWTRGTSPEKIVEMQVYKTGRCEQLYPSASFPRGVAGAPIAADIIKCQLRPIDPVDYGVPLGADEMNRLRRIFPAGVCDWSKPSIGHEKLATWMMFGPAQSRPEPGPSPD